MHMQSWLDPLKVQSWLDPHGMTTNSERGMAAFPNYAIQSRRAQHNIFHAITHSRRWLQKRSQSRPRQQHTKTECLADRRAKLLGGQTSQASLPVPSVVA